MNDERLCDWKEVWRGVERHGMVNWVWEWEKNVSYVLMFKITPKVLVGKIFCLSLSSFSDVASFCE